MQNNATSRKSKTKSKGNGRKTNGKKTKSMLSRLSTFFRNKPVKNSRKSMLPRLAKLGLSKFIRNAQLSENNLGRYVGKMTRKSRRGRRPLKFKARVFLPFKPIKTIIPAWIDKKYIKKGGLDRVAYAKS